ncbi:MAG TPA: S41 family peptidase [Flavisolibacter sp.]|jgi:C-terminal processing protease CtpA/Prc|nr:S41 family peptidase [Flavisolibacter sp.]
MKKRPFVLLLFLSAFVSAPAQKDSIRAHIDTAIQILQQHSLYAGRVNWDSARAQAYRLSAAATNKEQTFPAIAHVYKQLNDHHGWFEQYNDKLRIPDSTYPVRLSEGLKDEWAMGPKIKTAMLGRIAYLRMPSMPAYSQKQMDHYANWLLDSVISLNSRHPEAWIIDLRLNNGGNIVPMMSGFSGFFTDGVISYYLDKNNKPVSRSVISKGKFIQEDTIIANLKGAIPDLHKVKVAVLIGAGTGSSGEGVAANFQARKHSRLFGERSAGVANSTEGFLFNNNNSYFLITTSRLGDRHKEPLAESVFPDVMVLNNDAYSDLSQDNAVKAALAWLGK